MAEEPISTTVPETVTTDTGADAESAASLNDAFKDFWKEADAEQAPAAPSEGAVQETREKEAEPEEPKEPKSAKPSEEPPPKSAPEPEIRTADEIDKFELPPNARPEQAEQFKRMKECWKTDRLRAEMEASRVKELEAQLIQAKANTLTPELKADYEHAASVRRKFDFVSDPDFIQKFHVPVREHYENILEEAVAALPDKAAARDWAEHMKANYQPDQLNRDWWLEKVINRVPSELERASLLQSVTQLLKLQRERDNEIHKRTENKSAFDNWIKEKTNTTFERVQSEIMSEIGEQEKRIKEVLPVDVNSAKTKEEREAMEAHNERFARLNKFFTDTVHDLSKNGPRAWVRAAVEATRTQILEEHNRSLEKEVKETRAQRDQYKTELEKIGAARRKIAHSSGTRENAQERKNNQGLSLKDLDVRKSFDSYDWGDNSR
jgi:hypothetical protein